MLNPNWTIVYDSPDPKQFKYKRLNFFYIVGQGGLKGASLDDLQGSYDHKKHPIVWAEFGVADNSDEKRLRVYGIPWKSHPARQKDRYDMDSGDVTPTITNNGATVTADIPADYST